MKTRVEIKKLGINGEGIGYIHRKVCFVKGALINEVVEVEATQVKNKNYYYGQLLKVIKASPDRINNICHANKECLGCQLLHLKYPKQLEHKKSLIIESIEKYCDFDLSYVKVNDVVGLTHREGFIMNANIPVVDFKGKVTFGIYQRETKYLTVLTDCMKHHPLINSTLHDLENILNEHHCKQYNDRFKKGLRFIKIKVIEDKVHLVFITGKDGLKDGVVADIKKLPQVSSLFMSINTSKYQDFEDQGYTKIFGNTKNEYMYDGKKYLVSIKSDLPDNKEAYEIRNKIIKTMLKDSSKVISLNCGLGILETTLSQEVIGIDDKKEHIEDATYNARHYDLSHVKFVYGNIEKKVIPFAKKKIYDTFVIDNQKNGMPDGLKDTLRLAKVEKLIYISISPSTMAKDLQDLTKYYRVEEIKAVDSHLYQSYVTTIVKLVRK